MKNKHGKFAGSIGLLTLMVAAGAWAGSPTPATSGAIPSVRLDEPARLIEVPRWQPYDFVFVSAAKPANPFALSFTATLKGPTNQEFKTRGFYDGSGLWKVRFSPNAEGTWTLVTTSEAPDLNGKTVTFSCVRNPNPRVHGGLRVDADHPHHFIFEDGSRYFLMGYECDWLWALDQQSATLATLNPFLDKLASSGFNHVILNAYAHDTGWRKGNSTPDDFGPPPLYAWEGDNARPDHSRFNLAYWRHYDRVMEALRERGMIAHILIKVYNKFVNWPAKGGPEDDQYFQWLIARYAAFPNVVWDLAKEAHNEKDLAYKTGRLRLIKDQDPYQRLRTVHDDDVSYAKKAYDQLVDFRSDQQHGRWRATILAQRASDKWPAVNVEFGYEHGPAGLSDKTYGVVQSPEEVCRRCWEICMAGGYGAYYYTYTAWDVIRPQDTPPGYAYFQNLRRFFEASQYWLLSPAEDSVTNGYCLANPGREYLVFFNQSQPVSILLQGLPAPLKAEWYQPLKAQWQEAGMVSNGLVNLSPPTAWGAGPVALRIGPSRSPLLPASRVPSPSR